MEWWSWALTFIGLAGFRLARDKIWWCWYINIANQFLWLAYALVTEQWGFLVGIPFYLWVFGDNARTWTRDHFNEKTPVEEVPPPAPDLKVIDPNRASDFLVRIYKENGDAAEVRLSSLMKLWKEQHDAVS